MTENLANSVKAIIFDLGNVIVDFDHSISCRKLAQYSPYSPEQVYKKIITSGLEEQLDRGQISPETFSKSICNKLNIDIEIALFRKIWNNIFSLNTGIEQLIKRLQGKYKLLCLSNTNPWHFEFCMQTFPVLNSFDSFILSFKVGEKKPHKKIFQKATEEANAVPWKCLYIDDIKKFVKAAEDRGIKGIHFISAEQLEKELEVFGVL